MISFVLDCSVTMGWCFKDQSNGYTQRCLEALAKRSVVVPKIWHYEVTNVLVVAERRKKISSADSARFLQLLSDLPIQISDHSSLIEQSLLLIARKYALSAYDAAYLELAMNQGLPLATLDLSLKEACKKSGVKLF